MTKLRIISDLHYTQGINGPDYQKFYKQSGLWHYFGKKLQEPVDYTLIAGDICETEFLFGARIAMGDA